MSGDEEKIRRRHSNIPQDPLPFKVEKTSSKDEQRPKSQRSIRQAKCPHCCGGQGSNSKIGVIRSGAVEVFKDHDKFTHAGRRISCAGSRTEAPPA